MPIEIGDNPSAPAGHLPQGELGEARERVARAITQGRLFENQPQFTIYLHLRHDLAKNLLYHKISKGVTPDAISPS